MPLAHEEQEVVAVDSALLLEQEVAHEQVRPVRGALEHHEPRVCNTSTAVTIQISYHIHHTSIGKACSTIQSIVSILLNDISTKSNRVANHRVQDLGIPVNLYLKCIFKYL